jgi:lipoprotein-anchoring transpeptidase ErfK/SrfK
MHNSIGICRFYISWLIQRICQIVIIVYDEHEITTFNRFLELSMNLELTMKKLITAFTITLFMAFVSQASAAARLEARIDLSSQTMVVKQYGKVKYRWKISSGRQGYTTPTGQWSAKWLSKNHRSRKYNNAPMPYSVFFHGGYAVHGTNAIKRLGVPASHGCIRLHPENASKFYNLVQKTGLSNTRVIIKR